MHVINVSDSKYNVLVHWAEYPIKKDIYFFRAYYTLHVVSIFSIFRATDGRFFLPHNDVIDCTIYK